MTGESEKRGSKSRQETDKTPVKTDGSLEGADFKRLKRPVNADGFLVDRPLSPEEEGLAGPLPEGEAKKPQKPET